MKKLLLILFCSLCLHSTSFAADFEKLKLDIMEEDFIINMSSKNVAEKLKKIRTEYGADLGFFDKSGKDGVKDDWIINLNYSFGGLKFDFSRRFSLIISDGALVRIESVNTEPVIDPGYDFGVEDDFKDFLAHGTVMFGKPIYQKIEEKSGSIVWTYSGCKFEIEKYTNGKIKPTTRTVELVDRSLASKYPGEEILKLANLLKQDNFWKSLSPAVDAEKAMDEKNYEQAVNLLGEAIFLDPKPSTFIQRAQAHLALKDYEKAETDASHAFYSFLKKDGSKNQILEAFVVETQIQFERGIRGFELSGSKRTADYLIEKYDPQIPQIFNIRAICLNFLKKHDDSIKDEDICADGKRGCDLGDCTLYERYKKEGLCK